MRSWSPGQWALRVLVVVGPLVALYARGLAAERPPAWVGLLLLLVAVGWALLPESVIGVAALLLVGWAWAAADPGGMPAAIVLAAVGMVVAHLAALVIGYGPPRLPVQPSVVRLWARRGAIVLLPTLPVWFVARLAGELPDSRTVWVLGLAVALSVVVVAVAALQALVSPGDES